MAIASVIQSPKMLLDAQCRKGRPGFQALLCLRGGPIHICHLLEEGPRHQDRLCPVEAEQQAPTFGYTMYVH